VSEVTLYLADEQAMSDFGARIARVTQGHGLIFLEGNLGMGKTTLSRGIIRGLGHVGAVKSPTFTLVEPYEIGEKSAPSTSTFIDWSIRKSWSFSASATTSKTMRCA
jgi:tRNA threonylcarbamoyladenosine biosynthesis protein TsaE